MKRALFTILLFMTFLMADAAVMQRVYHKDYGVIDRTVLVFNRALDFKIDHHDNMVEILLPNCSRDEAKVSNEIFTNSNVFKSFTYKQNGNNLLMIILLNDDYTTVNHSEFSVEYLSFQQDVYKVALDIFATSNPVSNEELLSFVNFYTTMNQKIKAKQYKERLTLKIEQDKQKTVENISQTTKSDTQRLLQKFENKSPVSAKPITVKTLTDIKFYLILSMIILLIGLLIWLIIHIFKQGKKVENTSPKELNPVGRAEFRTRVIRKLLDHDWNKRVISLELKVPISEVEEVEKKYQLERANQLENDTAATESEPPVDSPPSPSFSEQKKPLDPDQIEETIPELEDEISEITETDNLSSTTTSEKELISVFKEEIEETEFFEKQELETEFDDQVEESFREKSDSEQNQEQEKMEDELHPGNVERDSDEVDEPEIDESLKEMLEYDSSDNPKGEMTQILENVTFNTNDIEDIRMGNEPEILHDDVKNDAEIPNERVHPKNDAKQESAMSKMLRKRFPKTDNDSDTEEIKPDRENPQEKPPEKPLENIQDDPDELLEKAITNKLDKLTDETT